MLAYILAIAAASGSLGLYLAAFLLPEVHRKYDLIWSGVGLFYGLVLWVCAGRITGGVLLGQVASVSLIGWFGWQTLKLRLAESSSAAKPLVQSNSLPFSSTAQRSLPELVKARVAQYRLRLRQNPETSSVLLNLDRLAESTFTALDRLRIWMGAMMSTAISDTVQSPPNSAPTSASTSPAASIPTAQPTAPQRVNPIASSTSSLQTSFTTSSPTSAAASNIEPNLPEVTTVRIEVESLSPPEATEMPEFAAEWSDLDFDTDPEMETIDGSIDPLPDSVKRSNPRSFGSIRRSDSDQS